MNRILVIRGGAIGDFILTLPALKALRDACPQSQIEILGYKHIAVLAEKRFYADSIRSIEYGPLSSFFAKNAELPNELANYFANFDLIISYLYDPDLIFAANLRRCGAKQFVEGPAKTDGSKHAARQFVRPLKELGINGDETPEKAETVVQAMSVAWHQARFDKDLLQDRFQISQWPTMILIDEHHTILSIGEANHLPLDGEHLLKSLRTLMGGNP